jgi:hypothetical protein
MPDVTARIHGRSWMSAGHGGSCAVRLSELRLEPQSWWARIAADPEAVFCVEESALKVRLRGNVLAEVELRGGGLACRIAPEHLLLSHPGARTVLGAAGKAAMPGGSRALRIWLPITTMCGAGSAWLRTKERQS